MWNCKKQQQRQHRRSNLSSVPVVSIGCSKLRSCQFLQKLHSHGHQQPPPLQKVDDPLPSKPTLETSSSSSEPKTCRNTINDFSSSAPLTQLRDGRSAARAYWERIKQLECELVQLEKLLEAEKDLIDHLKVSERGKKEIDDSTHDQIMDEIVRLKDGGLIKMLGGRLSQHNLAIHVSPPVVAEIGSTAFEVLMSMGSMRMEDLIDCLVEAMPMENVSGYNMEEIIAKNPTSTNSRHEKGFVKETILDAMERIEGLSMEGLKLQASVSLESYNPTTMMKKKVHDRTQKESVVVVVLIQMRDPVKGNGDVGDPMIGLIEVTTTPIEKEKNCVRRKRRFNVDGVHIAGLKHTANGGFIWSVSWKGYYGVWDSCSCRFERNSNISFSNK